MLMKTPERYVEADNISIAWARAIRPMFGRGGASEIAPLVVSVTRFDDGVPYEDAGLRGALDKTLSTLNKQPCHTVANTLFPQSYWNPSMPRSVLFDRYTTSLPRLRQASKKNRRGLYFERLVTGGPNKHPNQLDFIIGEYTSRKGVRRSALQAAVFDAKLDQIRAPRLGFPCLQHVSFAPTAEGLSVNGFYATQYAFERAYGNYLGLCRLGRFVAHELKVPLVRMTCFTGIMLRDEAMKKEHLDRIDRAVDRVLGHEPGGGG
jgi:hypothetical protein